MHKKTEELLVHTVVHHEHKHSHHDHNHVHHSHNDHDYHTITSTMITTTTQLRSPRVLQSRRVGHLFFNLNISRISFFCTKIIYLEGCPPAGIVIISNIVPCRPIKCQTKNHVKIGHNIKIKI